MIIMVFAVDSITLRNFRLDLMKDFLSKGHKVIAAGQEDGYLDEITAAGITYIPIRYKKAGVNPFTEVSVYKTYLHLIRKIKPDIIFAYNLKPIIWGLRAGDVSGIKELYAMVPGAGFLFSEDGGLKKSIIRKLILPFYRTALGKAKTVFFQNNDDMHEFLAMGLVQAEHCVRVNGSGVNTDHFYQAPLPANISFAFIGRLLKVKGVIDYCKAARLVRKRYPSAVFHLVGARDDNPTAISEQLLQSYIADGSIVYHGQLSDVRPVIELSSVYVLPSWHREGVPHAALEAMSMGRAVITVNGIGCREVLKEGINGLFVRKQDANDLANQMIWCIEHPDEVKDMGTESRSYCLERFAIRKVNDVIISHMLPE